MSEQTKAWARLVAWLRGLKIDNEITVGEAFDALFTTKETP